MRDGFNRIGSLIVLISYTIVAQFTGSSEFHNFLETLKVMFLLLVIPLILIWFGDWLADQFGTFQWVATTTKAPGWLINFIGWLLLVGLPPFLWSLNR